MVNAIGFLNTYPLNSDLSGGERYLTSKPGPVVYRQERIMRQRETPSLALRIYEIHRSYF